MKYRETDEIPEIEISIEFKSLGEKLKLGKPVIQLKNSNYRKTAAK